MGQLILELPKTLHSQLKTLAQSEGVSLDRYIIFALTRQAKLDYTVCAVPENEITSQKAAFSALLQSLGQASFAEIEQVLKARETASPEEGLSPEMVKRLQDRIVERLRAGGQRSEARKDQRSEV